MPTETRPLQGGILVVDKPAGITSAGVVRVVKRRIGGAKIGHLGTLDPFATGVLPLAIGEGSKLVPFLNEESKAYVGTVALGRGTDTLDSTGQTTEEKPVPTFTTEDLGGIATRFHGRIAQIPPMFSALKRDGRRLYDLARKGVAVDLLPRPVEIHELGIRLLDPGILEISVRCGKGTYVRSLARDIAAALGTVGHLSTLRRTAVGLFGIADAIPLERIEGAADLPIIGPRDALAGFREIPVSDEIVARIRRGQQYALGALPPPGETGEVAKVIAANGDLVALLEADGARWTIARVLAPTDGTA